MNRRNIMRFIDRGMTAMLRARRWAALVALGVVGLFLADRGAGQVVNTPVGPATSGGGGAAALHSSVKITEDSKFRQVINAGRECIAEGSWKDAVQALQAILNEKKDSFVQVREPDPFDAKKEITRWTSVKFEANNLIGSMPIEGLQTYEQTYGADAKTMLDEAKRNSDRELLADIAQRFCHTKAGIEANEIMATLSLARGQVFTAALRFEKLLAMNPEWAKQSNLTLFKAAIAFRRAGDTKNYDDAWKRLEGLPGVKVGEDMVPTAKLQEVLNETAVVDDINRYDWPSRGGNDRNSAQAMGSPPLLDALLWKRPLLNDKTEGLDPDEDEHILPRVMSAINGANNANIPVLPGFFPIASQGILVYKNYRQVCALALKNLELKDDVTGNIEKYKPGDILWKTIAMDHSLAELHQHYHVKMGIWLSAYENGVPAGFNSFLYDNTLLGSLMTDHRYVYAINDFGIPPHPGAFGNVNQFGVNPNQANFQFGDLKSKVMNNQLQAYDLHTGKLVWELNAEKQPDPNFKDSHFLSLPISIAGKLYVLNEKLVNPTANTGLNPFGGVSNPIGGDSELRLICLDPNKVHDNPEIQVLGAVVQSNRFVQDLSRRVNAVYLAYGEGVLVCPTNAGEVFGIDLMTRSLVWSYPYRESAHQQIQLPGMIFQQPNFGPGVRVANPFGTTTIVSKWKSAPPVIQDGKVVFTAPDADSIHCINLRDGKPVWKRGQSKGDLFMAGVYQGRVLVVSESSIRALDLKTGEGVWRIATGDLPSGQGVASKGIYYLPLKRGEILAIDIASGKIKAHNRAASGGSAPGNLVFYEGMVLSQTATEVMAYPQLVARLESARTEATADPDNLTKLTDFGDLLLKDGQVQTAVDTLTKVFDRKPAGPLAKRVRERLFEALTDLAQVDFDKVSRDYLTLYKGLCDVPGDAKAEEARNGKFLRLVGQGRESQGDLVAAFQMYKDFGALPSHRNDGVTAPEDPTHKIPVNVWLRGRIAGMMAKARPEQREPLEAKIAEEWKIVDAKKDIEAIRSFVGMFDIPFRVGRDARIRLAETIMDRNDRPAFLAAELLLEQVMSNEFRRDPLTGGRALAALAQLEEKKGTIDSMRLAAAYYRELRHDFAKEAVRGTKTGADLFNELATDKRFLPFLEEATNPWGVAKLKASEVKLPPNQYLVPGFTMQPDGDDTPFAKQHRLILDASDASNPRVHLRDVASNQNRWTTALGNVPMNTQIFFQLYQQATMNQAYHPNARFRFYHVKGHLIVCQVGIMVYCLDGDTGKKLWEMQNVETLPQNGVVHLQQVLNDAEGNPEFLFWNQASNQRFRITLGRIGAVQASYVAILGHKGLDVRDPLRGASLWKKADVPMNSHLFGDDQYLFLAEANEGGGIGAGRTIRASDGEVLNVPDFSNVYQARVRVLGRQILASQSTAKGMTLRLYDILSGKDVWSKDFAAGAAMLQTENRHWTGVVDAKGNIAILDAATGRELLSCNVIQGRITPEDVKGLQAPLLLGDAERFYVALNKPIDVAKVSGGMVYNNFNNGTRCQLVNGWFLALHRQDGQGKTKNGDIAWKKGDLAWHLSQPMHNQMIVVEQFTNSPILLFTSRFIEMLPNGGNRWTSNTHVFKKTDGIWVYDHKPAGIINGSPMYNMMMTDLKSRSINLLSFSNAVQIYLDDGKAPPPIPQVGAAGVGRTNQYPRALTIAEALAEVNAQRGVIQMPIERGFPFAPPVVLPAKLDR
jgi:outer membrane protein assembly factor BamB